MKLNGIKNIANAMLNDESRPNSEKRVICELMDAYIAGHKNPITEGYFFLDVHDEGSECQKAWNLAGKPILTPATAAKHVPSINIYRREYY